MVLDIGEELKKRSAGLKPMNRYFCKRKVFDKSKLCFGINCIDQVAGNILKTDFVVVSAPAGHGKTQIGSFIATHNAIVKEEKEKIAYIALEAYKGEIEDRIKWTLMKRKLKDYEGYLHYDEWIEGKYENNKIVIECEKQVMIDYKEVMSNNLYSSYVDEEYTIEECRADIVKAKNEYNCNMIILDHIHFFDLTTANENQEMKKIMKQLSLYAKIFNIPIVAISHLRKDYLGLCPGMADIHGSSDISKIATKVITFSHAKNVNKRSAELVPTYFRVCKTRKRGGTDFYIMLCDYDLEKADYEKDFNLYYLDYSKDKLNDIEPTKYPHWYNYTFRRKV